MKKYEILKQIHEAGLIAVVRGKNVEDALKQIDAIVEGGMTGIEVTYTTPNATKVIELANEKYGNTICLGSGTIMDAATAVASIHAGAKYIVSPHFDVDVALACNVYHIPYLPGVMTVKEVVEAHKYGVDIVKLFPGGDVGMGFAKNIVGPIPHFKFMPTGGVSMENFPEWFNAGAFSCGIGGFLTAPAKTGDYAGVTKNAKELMTKYHAMKEGK